MFIGLESQFLDICRKLVPALHRHYGWAPGARGGRHWPSGGGRAIIGMTAK